MWKPLNVLSVGLCIYVSEMWTYCGIWYRILLYDASTVCAVHPIGDDDEIPQDGNESGGNERGKETDVETNSLLNTKLSEI